MTKKKFLINQQFPLQRKRLLVNILNILFLLFALCGCVPKHGSNAQDPFEKYNRKVFAFNQRFDKYVFKPIATAYKDGIPYFLRQGINNVYSNLGELPTIANDLLQLKLHYALKDSTRFLINSSFGILGIFDFAKEMGLPKHYNDLGITFMTWGDTKSPYVIIPFLGPSTIRDSFAITFDYTLFTVYPYIRPYSITYGALALRYVDLRAQLLEAEGVIDEASIDPYTFQRNAYLQRREFVFNQNEGKDDDPYVAGSNDDDDPYVAGDEKEKQKTTETKSEKSEKTDENKKTEQKNKPDKAKSTS